MSVFYKRHYYREYTIVPRKTLSGLLDCRIYKGHRNPDTRTKGRWMIDVTVSSVKDAEDKIDELYYGGEKEGQTSLSKWLKEDEE